MSKDWTITAFGVLFTMLWFIASEIRGNSISPKDYDTLWKNAQKLLDAEN